MNNSTQPRNLFEVAAKLNAFGKQFRGYHATMATQVWPFNPVHALARVNVEVCDDEGPIDETQAPVGRAWLHLGVESYSYDRSARSADHALDAILAFAEKLGFEVILAGTGTGAVGDVHYRVLVAK